MKMGRILFVSCFSVSDWSHPYRSGRSFDIFCTPLSIPTRGALAWEAWKYHMTTRAATITSNNPVQTRSACVAAPRAQEASALHHMTTRARATLLLRLLISCCRHAMGIRVALVFAGKLGKWGGKVSSNA